MNDALDYRTLIKDCFAQRCQANPRYSLRAFARDLSLSPGQLSKVLNQKQGLSESTAKIISEKLGLSSHESETFLSLVTASDARSRQTRMKAQKALAEKFTEAHQLFEEDQFRLISDWYYLAFIDLAQTQSFKANSKWIAKRLGISVTEVEAAIERLVRLGIFERKGSQYICHPINIQTTTEVPSQSIRDFHRQILTKAQRALNEQSIEEREFSAQTFAIDTKRIPEFKTLIKKFKNEIDRIQNKSKSKKNEVYCLSLQFFRLTEKESL